MLDAGDPLLHHQPDNISQHHGHGHGSDEGDGHGVGAGFALADGLDEGEGGGADTESDGRLVFAFVFSFLEFLFFKCSVLDDRFVHKLGVETSCVLVRHIDEVVEHVLLVPFIDPVKLIPRVKVRHLRAQSPPLLETPVFKLFEGPGLIFSLESFYI